jgi:hypothetical protein
MKPICIPILLLLCSCAATKSSYQPDKKYSRQLLQEDFGLLRNILEKKHPSLYWYTPKIQMDAHFDSLNQAIGDSMTELQFGWQILAPLTQKIRCGHTTFSMSKGWGKYIRNRYIPSFPLLVKTWGDSMIVTENLLPGDSLVPKGSIINSINGLTVTELQNKMFAYLPTDGYANSVNYFRLSSNFPYFHRNIFGLYKNYRVQYQDSNGHTQRVLMPMWMPKIDSTKKADRKKISPTAKPSRKENKERYRQSMRSLHIDSNQIATLTLHTFSTGNGRKLRHFIKSSFKTLAQKNISQLIIDLRQNGGGQISMYALLTKYIRHTSFKVADSAFAPARSLSPYGRYITKRLVHNSGMLVLNRKGADGQFHLRFYEKHFYHPKKRHHYNGNVYVLTAGPTFSASALFCHAVKGQANVTIAGEETGGGWHGNSGVMIPDIVLPHTRLRVRLPLYRLVQYNAPPFTGTGVLPDWPIPPTTAGVRTNTDRKMLLVKQHIIQQQNSATNNPPQ